MTSPFIIRPESADDFYAIETITQKVFGPAIYTRAAHILRQGTRPILSQSFVAVKDEKIIGSVRSNPIYWGEKAALMLGPLGVLPAYKNQGVGKALMQACVGAARIQAQQDGKATIMMLVGDHAYYAPFGFKPIPLGQIVLPRPADPHRILACELVADCLPLFEGEAKSRIV